MATFRLVLAALALALAACTSNGEPDLGPSPGPASVGRITGATFDDTGDLLTLNGDFASNDNGADLRVYIQGAGPPSTPLPMVRYTRGGITVQLPRDAASGSGDLWIASTRSSVGPSDTVQVTDWLEEFVVSNFDLPTLPDTGSFFRRGDWRAHIRGVLNTRLHPKTIAAVRDGVVEPDAGGLIWHAPGGVQTEPIVELSTYVGEALVLWAPISDLTPYQDVLATINAAGELIDGGFPLSFRAFVPLGWFRTLIPPGTATQYHFNVKADNVPVRLRTASDYAILGDDVIRVNLREGTSWKTIRPIFPPKN